MQFRCLMVQGRNTGRSTARAPAHYDTLVGRRAQGAPAAEKRVRNDCLGGPVSGAAIYNGGGREGVGCAEGEAGAPLGGGARPARTNCKGDGGKTCGR